MKDSEDCRRTVTEFVRKELHEHVTEDDIEVAHTLPIPTPARPAQSATRGQVTTPVVIVRFCRRDVRDRIIVKRKVLKSTKIAKIVEDLTSLNMEVLNRLRNNDAVQKTWSSNGHIRALLKNGKKIKSDRLSQLKTVLLNEVLMSRCVPVVDVLVMLIHCLSYMYINVAS